MPVFLACAGLVAVLTLAFVLRPVWAARRSLAISLFATVALSGGLLYWTVGTPAALDPAQLREPASLEEAIARLETRLEDEPREIDGWRLLGRSYATVGRLDKASAAFARAAALAPDDPDVLVDAAESRALATPRRTFDRQSVAQLQRALRLQPDHQRARWFLGIAQRQAGDPAAAARTWAPLLSTVDAATAATLQPEIEAARTAAGLPPLPPEGASRGNALRVSVSLDPDLAARARPDPAAAVFVIARPVDGPPMPVAVQKHAVAGLPLTTTLDDADSPMPAMPLSALREVEVIARISRAGIATPATGDLESKPVRIRLPAADVVDMVITDVRP